MEDQSGQRHLELFETQSGWKVLQGYVLKSSELSKEFVCIIAEVTPIRLIKPTFSGVIPFDGSSVMGGYHPI